MRLTKIYTKVGDKGDTLLASGEKIRKNAPRIEAYGTIDELNSFVGLLRDNLKENHRSVFADVDSMLHKIQNELFDIGGELATPAHVLDKTKQKVVQAAEIERLEAEIDQLNASLQPLVNFVLPGGVTANSLAHVARTVCRRAERLLVSLRDVDATVRPDVLIYVNRLSDWLFVVSRIIATRLDKAEVLWSQQR